MPNERENPLIFNYFRVSMIKFSICIVDIVNKNQDIGGRGDQTIQ
jgi:hypothetical protein